MAARVTAFVVIAIVAVTFVAGLIVGAQRADDSGPVDLIVYNARVYTGNPDAPFAEAIAVRGTRILRVGSNREIKRLMRRATSVIDAHGGSVTPGFHDGGVDLFAAGTAEALALQMPAAAKAPGAATVASSTSASATPAPNAAPASKSTSSASPVTAPAVTHAPTATIANGSAADTGMLDVLRAAMSGANRVGVTSVEVTAHDESDLAPYDTLLKGRGLTTRVAAAMAVDWPLDEAAIEKLEATRRRYQRVPVFKVDAVRLTVSDGFDASGAPIEPATAAGAAGAGVAGPGAAGTGSAGKASHARRATPPRGRAAAAKAAAAAAVALATRKTDLSQTIARLGQRGWQIILQTSDAGDVDLALTAVASSGVAADAPNPKALKRRIRLELSAPVDNATVSRLARLGVIPSLQQPATAGLRNDAATANGADTARLLSSPASSATSATADDASPNQARAEVSPATAMTGASADAASDVAGDGSDATSDATPAAAAAAGTSATTGDEVTAVGAARKSAAPTGTGATAETATADEPESWPYANLLASATPFVFHSDWPAAALDPRLALSTVLLEGFLALSDEATTIADDSKISARLTRALDAYTRYAAFASADEEQNGTIAKERLADLVIFSTDLFALTPTKLLDAEVTTTIFDGKVVFIRQPEPATAGIPATQ